MLGLGADQRLVKVKSWLPSFDGEGCWWPTMLIQRSWGGRQTVQPRLWRWPWVKRGYYDT